MAEELNDQEKAAQWFIDQIRRSMLDYEELNELINNVEISNEEIRDAIFLTVDSFNRIDPPLNNYTVWDFPSQSLLVDGTIARLLMSGSILHYRNRLPYTAGGISVQTHDKGPDYERIAARLQAKFDQDSDIMKRSLNVQNMLAVSGGVVSQYGLMNWYRNWHSFYIT